MSKYKQNTSTQTINEAEKMAKAIQRPGQTKEQTKLIAQGIQKGIELYKKKNKVKARDLDKRLKTAKTNQLSKDDEDGSNESIQHKNKSGWLPWSLLIISWIGFFLYNFQIT